MAKNKKSAAKRPNTASKPTSTALPSFNEQALSALTDTLDKKLGKSTAPPQIEVTANKKQGKKSNEAHPTGSKKLKGIESGRGTKRDAQGNAKADERSHSKSKKSNGTADGRSVLLQEILALDGTEDDLNLLENAASDNEDLVTENSKSLDKSLQKELAKFAASLGIEAQVIEDASEPEEGEDLDNSEEEQDAEEWEEASDLESAAESETAPSLVAKKPEKATTTATKPSDSALSKDANRLVSTLSSGVIGLTNIL